MVAAIAMGTYGTALALVDIAPRVEARGVDRIVDFMRAHPEGFATLEDAAVSDQSTWKEVQNKFDLIILLGKNIKICEQLLHNRHGLYTSAPNRLPILVLHD